MQFVYRSGELKFVDLCRGGHSERHTGKTGVSSRQDRVGAYRRGDEQRPMLQRIYGFASAPRKSSNSTWICLKKQETGSPQTGTGTGTLYLHENVGPGLPLWLPLRGLQPNWNGWQSGDRVSCRAMLAYELQYYQRVLYHTSGHLPYYKDSMYFRHDRRRRVLPETDELSASPHLLCGASKSYRDLPLRYAEYGTCYRYEDSGALFGLMRVRSLQMNDAHIYCTEEQFEQEFIAVVEMYLKYFKMFGDGKYVMRLSLHSGLGKKYVDEPELWKTKRYGPQRHEKAGVPTVEVADEAAFYGPKIDVQVWSAIGREFTLATNQIDLVVPKRFELTPMLMEKRRPRSVFTVATLVRMNVSLAFWIEHFGGNFPTWMAPVQVKVLPVSDKFNDYAQEVATELFNKGVRVKVDDSNESLGKKIRAAEMLKTPYMLIVGEKEVAENKVSVRNRKTKEQTSMGVDEFNVMLFDEIKQRVL
ncbi:MAG: threonine--tRNA ligase [Candidatus Gracilibacteria bacterium]